MPFSSTLLSLDSITITSHSLHNSNSQSYFCSSEAAYDVAAQLISYLAATSPRASEKGRSAYSGRIETLKAWFCISGRLVDTVDSWGSFCGDFCLLSRHVLTQLSHKRCTFNVRMRKLTLIRRQWIPPRTLAHIARTASWSVASDKQTTRRP